MSGSDLSSRKRSSMSGSSMRTRLHKILHYALPTTTIAGLICIAQSAAQESVTLLLINGRIWTVNPQQKEAEAVAIAANKIVGVGSTADILKLKGPGTATIDLDGRRVLPGFNDAHVHFFAGGSNLTGPQLRYSRSQSEFRNTLEAFVHHVPKAQWITGGNWDHENWRPAALPSRQLIDPVTPDRPVPTKRLDGHMSLANSVALKLAGVNKDTKDVPGGVIVRDADGNPTGILKDAAQALVAGVIPPPTEDQIITAV